MGLSSATLVLPQPSFAQAVRFIPQRPSARVIVDNDFAGDPDGLVALAHSVARSKDARDTDHFLSTQPEARNE